MPNEEENINPATLFAILAQGAPPTDPDLAEARAVSYLYRSLEQLEQPESDRWVLARTYIRRALAVLVAE